MNQKLRLGVNIDHVATLRNARGEDYPSIVEAAKIAEAAGAHGITMHLREDRRHIRDQDLFDVKAVTGLPINFEMAASIEMQKIALDLKPNAVCIVPESRKEMTTESGLEVYKNQEFLKEFIAPFKKNNIRVSLFIDPNLLQVEAAKSIGADIIEIHTGLYAHQAVSHPWHATEGDIKSLSSQDPRSSMPLALALGTTSVFLEELNNIKMACSLAAKINIECHAGHGLNYTNVAAIAEIYNIMELNIGHFLISEAIFIGLKPAIEKMLLLMRNARN